MEYEFFNSEGAEGKFLTANTAIRSRTMTNALRMRSKLKAGGGAPTKPLAGRAVGGTKGRFRLARAVHNRIDDRHGPSQSAPEVPRFKSSALDPFHTFPVPNIGGVDVLLQYFWTSFNLNMSLRDGMGSKWFASALHSPLIMHATLATIAVLWNSSVQEPHAHLRASGYYHKTEGLRAVIAKLPPADTPITEAVACEVLCAISALANAESIDGNIDTAAVHLGGIDKVLKHTGGWSIVSKVSILRKCIGWVDLQTSAGLGRPCRFPELDEEDTTFHGGPKGADLVRPPAEADSGLMLLEGVLDANDAIAARGIFTLLQEALSLNSTPGASAARIRTLINRADRRLVDALFGANQPHQPHHPPQAWFRSLLLSAHVFLYVWLRKVPADSGLGQILLDRLRNSLADERLVRDSETWLEGSRWRALVWMASVGVAACRAGRGREGRGHFLSILSLAVERMEAAGGGTGPSGMSGVRQAQRMFLWDEDYFRPAVDEFQLYRATVGGS